MYLKACPRCRGDMNSRIDVYGAYRECLQCGNMIDEEKPNRLLSVAIPKGKKKVA